MVEHGDDTVYCYTLSSSTLIFPGDKTAAANIRNEVNLIRTLCLGETSKNLKSIRNRSIVSTALSTVKDSVKHTSFMDSEHNLLENDTTFEFLEFLDDLVLVDRAHFIAVNVTYGQAREPLLAHR